MTEEGKEIISVMKEMFGVLDTKINTMGMSINERLTSLDEKVISLELGQQEMNTKIDNLQQEMNTKIDNLQHQVTDIKMTLENETNRNITLLVDGYIQNTDKLDALAPVANDVAVVKCDVSIIKAVITTHSGKLQRLERAN